MPYGLQSLPDCTGTTGDVGFEQVYPPPDLGGQAPDHIIGRRFLAGEALPRLLVSGETQVRGGATVPCIYVCYVGINKPPRRCWSALCVCLHLTAILTRVQGCQQQPCYSFTPLHRLDGAAYTVRT